MKSPPPEGLTVREYFAAKALAGIMANPQAEPVEEHHFNNIAEDAVRAADTLIRALAVETP